MQRLVLIGNCQVQSLYHLYRRFAGNSRKQHITYIRSYEEITDADRNAIGLADIVVEQVQDFKPVADIAGTVTRGERIGVPVVNCGFLWPFAGQPHPQNPKRSFIDGGPYGSETSDAHLNRLLKRGIDPETAFRTHVELDVNAMVSLDRLLEISLEKQRHRDELTGFQLAGLIEDTFRDEQPFLTPYHPNTRIAMALASQFFEKLGVGRTEIALMNRATRVTPFPKEELPVHPAVARHYGLRWATPERRYRFLAEGSFTFEEFTRRYLSCTWNEALEEGLYHLRSGDATAAEAKLTEALEMSPSAPAAYEGLSHVHELAGDLPAALSAIRQAIALEPMHAPYRAYLGALLARTGRPADAEHEFRIAAAIDPFEPHYSALLANHIGMAGEHVESLAVAWHGLTLAPFSGALHVAVGNSQRHLGQLGPAEQAYRAAAELDPKSTAPLLCLADVCELTGRPDGAVAWIEQALVLDAQSTHIRSRYARALIAAGRVEEATGILQELGESVPANSGSARQVIVALRQAGDLAGALDASVRAIEQFPSDYEIRRLHIALIEQTGDMAGAAEAASTAIAALPDHPQLRIVLGDLSFRLGRQTEAEAAFRDAISLAPNAAAHAYGQLGNVLSSQGRHDEAIAARTKAMSLEPDNPHRSAQLGHVLMSAGRYPEAVAAIKAALARDPKRAEFYNDLSHALSRGGDIAGAIDAAQQALRIEPNSMRFQAHVADLYARAQRWEEAEAAYRAALGHGTRDPHVLGHFSRFLAGRHADDEALLLAQEAVALAPNDRWLQGVLESVRPRQMPQAAAE